MHVADRRHGLDVVASLRAEGVTEPDLLVAGLLHDAGKGDTGVWPRVAYALGSRMAPGSRRVARRAARVRARARAAPDPRRDVRRDGGRGRVLATDRRADPQPGRAARPRVRRAAASRRRGQLMRPGSVAGDPGHGDAGRARRPWTIGRPADLAAPRAGPAGRQLRRGSPAREPDPGPDGRVRWPAGAAPVADRGAPARRPDGAAGGPRRRLPRRPRAADRGPAWQRQLVRGDRQPADPDQEPGDAAASHGPDRPAGAPRRRHRPGGRAPRSAAALSGVPRRRCAPRRRGRPADRALPSRAGCRPRCCARRRATGRRTGARPAAPRPCARSAGPDRAAARTARPS